MPSRPFSARWIIQFRQSRRFQLPVCSVAPLRPPPSPMPHGPPRRPVSTPGRSAANRPLRVPKGLSVGSGQGIPPGGQLPYRVAHGGAWAKTTLDLAQGGKSRPPSPQQGGCLLAKSAIIPAKLAHRHSGKIGLCPAKSVPCHPGKVSLFPGKLAAGPAKSASRHSITAPARTRRLPNNRPRPRWRPLLTCRDGVHGSALTGCPCGGVYGSSPRQRPSAPSTATAPPALTRP